MLGVPLLLYVDSIHAFLTVSRTSGGVGLRGVGFFGATNLAALTAAILATELVLLPSVSALCPDGSINKKAINFHSLFILII